MARLYGIAQIFGIFECLSTIFLIVAITLINLLINQQVSNEVTANHSRIRGPLKGMSQATRVPLENVILSNQDKFSSITYPFGIFVSIYDYTKGGRPTSSIQYFYKVLNSPPLIEELRILLLKNFQLKIQYDFEGYYQQQLQTFSVSSMDDYSYDPNMPVPREIMPYYISFYQTFIDSMGPASVNISGATVKHIYSEMCTTQLLYKFKFIVKDKSK
ncbi:hypothetical protein LY90DRAFT_515460 [Neocallimastix californiae]|uniref:Uncharacterized protein n=1 Tax=Neocallimastix californiae TaxID=1754190 RepID=A0A1Y2AJE4_9FUNG|nr:hypothetical protein LY90DRAFT_515460 [Neocallimastix californiae]|eukprot:ORY22612.1 hypothetical protein LY90DRAFT_515460 [Neocallimastix californiae]